MLPKQITFIGAGNMARSLVGGLIEDGYPPDSLCLTAPNREKLSPLTTQLGVRVSTDNRQAAMMADVLVFAVKPLVLQQVTRELAETVAQQRPLIISIVAGIPTTLLQHWFELPECAIVRAMPNTPALVRSGASGLYANPSVTRKQKDLAETILRAVGITLWVDEEVQLDIVTALSGSGPAYFFLLMEALEQSAIAMGLPPATAHLLTLQTALGSARLAMERSIDVAELRKQVTSPGGTTERALHVLEQGGIRSLVASALKAAQQRAQELAQQAAAE